MVLMLGILAGVCFYRQYLREKVHRLNGFIPYSDRQVDPAENSWVNQYWRDGPTLIDESDYDNDNDENES